MKPESHNSTKEAQEPSPEMQAMETFAKWLGTAKNELANLKLNSGLDCSKLEAALKALDSWGIDTCASVMRGKPLKLEIEDTNRHDIDNGL